MRGYFTSSQPERLPSDRRAQGQLVLSCKRKGVALINKVRMLDPAARKARRIEPVPQAVIDEALERLMALLGC